MTDIQPELWVDTPREKHSGSTRPRSGQRFFTAWGRGTTSSRSSASVTRRSGWRPHHRRRSGSVLALSTAPRPAVRCWWSTTRTRSWASQWPLGPPGRRRWQTSMAGVSAGSSTRLGTNGRSAGRSGRGRLRDAGLGACRTRGDRVSGDGSRGGARDGGRLLPTMASHQERERDTGGADQRHQQGRSRQTGGEGIRRRRAGRGAVVDRRRGDGRGGRDEQRPADVPSHVRDARRLPDLVVRHRRRRRGGRGSVGEPEPGRDRDQRQTNATYSQSDPTNASTRTRPPRARSRSRPPDGSRSSPRAA